MLSLLATEALPQASFAALEERPLHAEVSGRKGCEQDLQFHFNHNRDLPGALAKSIAESKRLEMEARLRKHQDGRPAPFQEAL